MSSAKSLIALARSSSVDVLSITMAEAPVIAISIASSFNAFAQCLPLPGALKMFRQKMAERLQTSL